MIVPVVAACCGVGRLLSALVFQNELVVDRRTDLVIMRVDLVHFHMSLRILLRSSSLLLVRRRWSLGCGYFLRRLLDLRVEALSKLRRLVFSG